MKYNIRVVFLWSIIFVAILSLTLLIKDTHPLRVKINFSDFLASVQKNEIQEVIIESSVYLGKYKSSNERVYPYFETVGPADPDQSIIQNLQKSGVQFSFIKPKDFSFWQALFIGLPVVLLLLLGFFILRQIQMGGSKTTQFGKSRARLISDSSKKVTFADIAGVDEAREELVEIVDFLKDPKKFTKLGARIPKGVLLMGSPGTGKTLLARAIAGEAGVPFFSISGSDFVEMFVGVGASRVRDLFDQAQKQAPCIIFVDEIDAVGRQRGSGLGGGHDEREQTLNQLLVEMDGFESSEGIILIAATNRPDVLDPALLRPGRFDRRIMVSKPDVKGRESILKIHSKKIPLSKEVDLQILAKGSIGFSGADLENMVNESALLAARQNKKVVEMVDFEKAKDKVIMGVERKSLALNANEKKSIAYHEAGHALVASYLEGTDPIHKISIIPRGMALGVTQQLPEYEKYTESATQAKNRIAILMGGRLAEEIILEEISSGASDDIEKATELARKMVCEWGMSQKLGPLAFGKREETLFFGKEMSRQAEFSEQTALTIDSEIQRLVLENYQKAKSILIQYQDQLVQMAEALLEFESLDVSQIKLILAGQNLVEQHKQKQKQSQENKHSESYPLHPIGISPKIPSPLAT